MGYVVAYFSGILTVVAGFAFWWYKNKYKQGK